MPFYRNNAGTAQEVRFYVNQGGVATPLKVYENQGGTAVLISEHSSVTYGTTVQLEPPNNSNSSTATNGIYCQVNSEVAGVRCTIVDDATHPPQNFDYAAAVDANGARIAPELDISSLTPGDSFEIMFDSPRTLDFGVGIGDSAGNHIRSRDEDATFPYTGTEIDATHGMYSEGPSLTTSTAYNFSSLTPIL